MSWGIYGASGVTGTLIVAEAIKRGHRPVLLGRSEATLRPIAERWDLLWRTAPTSAHAVLDEALRDLEVVVNAAAPFSTTVPPLLEACVRTGTSYLDLSNEFETVSLAFTVDAAAASAGITVVPGVGFGTVASNAVLRCVTEALPGAAVLEVALLADNAPGGTATRESVFAVLASGAAWYRSGAVRYGRLGTGIRTISTPVGTRSIVPIATGDLAAAHYSAPSAAVTVATVALPVPAAILRVVLPVLQSALRTGVPQRVLGQIDRVARGVRGFQGTRNSTDEGSTIKRPRARVYSSLAWARATSRDGRTATAWLDTGEGYAFSASSAVSAVEKVLAGTEPGAWTPSQAFGVDFAFGIPGTRVRLWDDNELGHASSQS
jgi:short subunit dehydrogenase-like uncharacterized protein